MDSAHDDSQRDFISNLFPMDHSSIHTPTDNQFSFDNIPTSNQHTPTQYPSTSSQHQQPMQNMTLPFLDMDALSSVLSSDQTQSIPNSTTQLNNMMLEQQYKLTQLQQLQALQQKIIQHQIQLLSGQLTPGSSTEMRTDAQNRVTNFHGLPTPVSSVEMRPQPGPEFVTPLNLHPYPHDVHNLTPYMNSIGNQNSYQSQQLQYPRGSSSAPAHIAFRKTGLPMEMDLDISPLTSPWLGADPVVQRHNKRTASPSGDDSAARKKASPAIVPTNVAQSFSSSGAKKTNRVCKPVSAVQINRSRRNSNTGEHDTPSPVEMPPPAQPTSRDASDGSIPSSPAGLTPVTPASIMNLGNLAYSSSLVPPQELAQQNAASKSRSPRTRASSTADAAASAKQNRPTKKNTGQKSQVVTSSPNLGPSEPKKTSHKAAEQKRRDSLKTTFDELRNLLPPIPLPTDDRTEERILPPGALPPRGPPKAGADGPNKAVSKLQLLICGNEYIRQLNGRIERRDGEIGLLRAEIRRLRAVVDVEDSGGGNIDLEKDLDAVETLSSNFGRTTLSVTAEEDEDVAED